MRWPTMGGPIQVLDLRWDGADRLREVKENNVVVFTAAYNGDGLRVSKWDLWTGQHDYSWGPGGLLHDSNGSTTYTPGLAQRVGSTDRFFHTDWLGSTRWMSDGANGNSFPVYELFDSFGNRQTDVTTPGTASAFAWGGAWGYQSEYQDASVPGLGLVYMERRYYDPAIGRFISADPIGLAGGLNLYSYTLNDPINLLDPTGLYWRERLAFAGGIVGAIGGSTAWGIGSLPGMALGTGVGAYIGSRLDGESIGRSAFDGVCHGALAYGMGAAEGYVLSKAGPVIGAGVGRLAARAAAYRPKMLRGSIGFPRGTMRFPATAEELDELLGFEGIRRPDVDLGDPTRALPGRGRVDWDISTPTGRMRITHEQHPYDVSAPASHRGPHWHVDWPGRPPGPHPRFLPGDPFPSY